MATGSGEAAGGRKRRQASRGNTLAKRIARKSHVKEILVRGQIFCCERFHDTSLCQSVCIVSQSLHVKVWSPANVAFCTVGMQLSRGLRNA